MQRRELWQTQLVAQPDHHALAYVSTSRDRREEGRLVHDDEPLVAVQDGHLAGHLGLVAQVAVEPHEGVRSVGVVGRDRAPVVVDEALIGEHPLHVDLVRALVPQPRSHRRPRSRSPVVEVGRAHPRGAEPVAGREG
ncbi:hypothetical protein LP422_00600 [Janibacter limosus]|uniref:Uncharacterized protein n=1 Tax=Janibacter limosus TaxID=53458 RepID=A0AC61U4H9_9MICO|nr:hypothetical protein [Janibacter limosus]UUZ44934.1 hypothetical protein LP422_00600 [Janibacter limosus]